MFQSYLASTNPLHKLDAFKGMGVAGMLLNPQIDSGIPAPTGHDGLHAMPTKLQDPGTIM